MIYLFVIVLLISFFEVRAMCKHKLKKEIIVFTVCGVITLLYGYYFLKHIHTASFARYIFSLIGLDY